MKPCPFCAEQILSAAVKCKHCGSMLDGSAPAVPTTIAHVSPGATLNAPITLGKGKLTGIGIAGIVVGILAFLLGAVAGGEVFLMGGGVFFIVASFLWARRP
jgi:hypothetical protein